jgi:gentisate 1,2-dioxygenase
VIGGQQFSWSAGDVFVVPSWLPLDHQADREADLFAVSDLPVLEKLGLARSQTLPQRQAVTGEWHPGRPAGGSAVAGGRVS